MDNKSKFGIGLAVGVFIGGVLALLFTPKSGKENRQIIKAKIVQLKDKIKSRRSK